jgi:F-type H+-transporting ATPase subunit alpha
VAGNLRVTLSQFEELEDFARFGTRLDDATRARLVRGAAVRASLRQAERDPMAAVEQMAVLIAAMDGQLDGLTEAESFAVMGSIRAAARGLDTIAQQIAQNVALTDAARAELTAIGAQARQTLGGGHVTNA